MWHFSKLDMKLGYGDSRLIRAGKTLSVPGPIHPCIKGLHASTNIIDALRYSPGPYVWYVELSGEVKHSYDKSVATERKALWGYDASDILRVFSRKVALDAVRKYWITDLFGEYPSTGLKWLEDGDEFIQGSGAEAQARFKARSAAWAAAWAAASTESAAKFAVESAAKAAAESAAWATDSNAESAAKSAARSAAWAAAWAAASTESAASTEESAAWLAAESAAKSRQNELLEEMILAGHLKK